MKEATVPILPSSRYRVAHVITRLCKGGAQENTFHTVRLADHDRFDVDLIAGPMSGAEGSLEAEVQAAGIKILREPNLVRDVAPFKDFTALRSLTRLFRARRYHIVHTHTSKAGFIGRMAAKRAGVPIVVHTPHGNIFHGYFGPWPTRVFVWLERYATRHCDRVIELTRAGIEESLAQRIGSRDQYVSIFSGIDLRPFEQAISERDQTRRELGAKPGTLLVGAVGRLEPVKGIAYVLDVAESTRETLPGARFAIAGAGSLEARLREQAQALGDRVQFLGLRSDVPRLMAAFDVLLVPSINEGMGRVILEAGAAQTPVIASAVGGIPEIVVDAKTGVLVPPQRPDAMAEVLVALTRDPERRVRMGRAARDRVVPQFGIENMAAQIETLYMQLIREKRLDP